MIKKNRPSKSIQLLHINVWQHNVNSLKGMMQKCCIEAQLTRKNIHIAGFQETRDPIDDMSKSANKFDYLVILSWRALCIKMFPLVYILTL